MLSPQEPQMVRYRRRKGVEATRSFALAKPMLTIPPRGNDAVGHKDLAYAKARLSSPRTRYQRPALRHNL